MDICSGLLDRMYLRDVLFLFYPIPLQDRHILRGTIHHHVMLASHKIPSA